MRTNTRGRCFAVISYSYEVEGEYYSGEWSGPAFPTEEEAAAFAEAYLPRRSSVIVLHHPSHPERSTLQVDPRLGQPDEAKTLML